MFSQMPEATLEAYAAEMSRIAGSEMTYEVINDTMYFFGSELGTLRMFKKYNTAVRNLLTDSGWSENRGSYYFSITARNY